jgi:hypothetical protein
MIKSTLVKKKIGNKTVVGPKNNEIVNPEYITRLETKTLEKEVFVIPKFNKKIVRESVYTTNGEDFLLIKDIDECRIILDPTTTSHIIIKSLTNGVIDSNGLRIDEYYDELMLEKGVCVELVFLDDFWYVTSSDGLKMI